jgi:hypothetical protein
MITSAVRKCAYVRAVKRSGAPTAEALPDLQNWLFAHRIIMRRNHDALRMKAGYL